MTVFLSLEIVIQVYREQNQCIFHLHSLHLSK